MVLAEPSGEQSPSDVHSFVRRRETSSLNRQKPGCFQVQAKQGFQPAWLPLGMGFSYRSLKGAGGKHMVCQEVSRLLSECLLPWEISRGAANCTRLRTPGGNNPGTIII